MHGCYQPSESCYSASWRQHDRSGFSRLGKSAEEEFRGGEKEGVYNVRSSSPFGKEAASMCAWTERDQASPLRIAVILNHAPRDNLLRAEQRPR